MNAKRCAAGGGLALLMTLGLGCMNVMRIRNVDGWYDEIDHAAWIPWLVMGLAVIGCMALLGALRPLRLQCPWNCAPALALGLVLCIVTDSPLVWVEFDASRWNVPCALVFLYALLAVEFVRLLLHEKARGMAFDGKQAARLAGVLALAYLPALVSVLAQAAVEELLPVQSGAPVRAFSWVRLALYLAGGALGCVTARRGRRGAGIFLTALASALVLAFLAMSTGAIAPVSEWGISGWPLELAVRAADGLTHYASMSAYGFLLFAGVKCLLPERNAA